MKLLKILSFLYLLACCFLYAFQEKVIFAAHSYPNDQAYSQGYEIEIPLEGKLTMNACIVPAKKNKKSKGAILYLHGNKGNIHRGLYQARSLKNRGHDLMVVDYRGYGKTEGQPQNDKQMLEDVQKAYNYLKSNYDESQIYIVGYSLGTGMASYLAAKNKPAHIFLVAPFTSLTAIKDQYLWMFPDFLLKYKLSNQSYLKEATCPVTLVHGTADQLVLYEYSQKLKKLHPAVNLISVPGQSHRGIIFDRNLVRAFDQYIK